MSAENLPLPAVTVATDTTVLRALQASRHVTVGPLGRGAMGEVVIAQDQLLQRQVALKHMDPDTPPDLAARFFNEVQITAQLDHPNIVPVYSLERPDGQLSYTMKLVRGRTLSEVLEGIKARIAQRKPLSEDELVPARLDLFLQVCSAVAYAHGRGVIHRDLKPDNIMVGEFRDVLVMDWGIARLADDEDGPTPVQSTEDGNKRTAVQTLNGFAIGTPAYMSPEQAMGRNSELDARSDQYALGLILHEILTLERAIPGGTVTDVMTRAASAERRPLVAPGGDRIPRELAAIIARATAPTPDGRYPNVDALADDIRRFLRDEAVLAQPDSVLQRMQRWISHHRELTLVIGFLLVLSVLGVGTVTVGLASTAVIAAQYRAEQREQRLGELLSMVTRQSHRMDTELQRYESLLVGLSFVAVDALSHDPGPVPYLLDEDWLAGPGPADLEMAAAYHDKVSVDMPITKLAPGVDAGAIDLQIRQLASLRPQFWKALLRSQSDEAITMPPPAQRLLVLDQGVPIVWAIAATEAGNLAGLPGHAGYPAGYDPRKRPWYLDAKAGHTPVWGPAYIDAAGAGIVVPVSVALRDADGGFLGAANFDISIRKLVDELLDPPGLQDVEAYLVDSQGKVVVQSSLKEVASTAKTHEPPPFPWPAVLAAVAQGRSSGYVEVESADGTPRLLLWSHLFAVDWTYVIEGPSDKLLH